MSVKNPIEMEGLRRLNLVEMGAVDGIAEMLALAAHQRVGGGEGGDGGRVAVQRLEQPIDYLCRAEGSCRIVNQHDVRRTFR